ncbi:MAG: glycosyltransferase family 39 protein, partial [Candidatus Omnitrophica bacterium]|nr:glycosyltransferase family 39 protein [Candidatus Omnitrophota bacterium]
MKTKKNILLPIYIALWLIFSISILFYHKNMIFPSFCADGQTRAVLGAKWIHAPFLMNEPYSHNSIWLPLQYWIIGLGLKIFYDLYWVPVAINLLFSAGSLWFLYKISWMFYENRVVSFISVLLAGSIPWFIWLSISGMSEPMAIFFIITSVFFYFNWLKDINRIQYLI